ncbi:MAG: hypothetical protein HY731_07665 [Candidatus Tectomicrobia bacterium]|nr:hypothetical protein [Candidatus Tectomicrobia bacterium]
MSSHYIHQISQFLSMLFKDLKKRIGRKEKHSHDLVHHYLVQLINRELSRSQRFHQQFGLLLLDLPDLVPHGVHKFFPGKTVAVKDIEGKVRPYDMVAEAGLRRYMVILPQTDLTGIVVVKERMKTLAQQQGWGGTRLGLALYPQHGNTGDSLLQWAKFDLQREEEIKEQDSKLVRSLLESRQMTQEQLAQALEYQRSHHIPLGKLAQQKGYLTSVQAEEIIEYQQENQVLFGEAATNLKYLTEEQVEELLESQKRERVSLSDILATLKSS